MKREQWEKDWWATLAIVTIIFLIILGVWVISRYLIYGTL